jgi:hypothetical protein
VVSNKSIIIASSAKVLCRPSFILRISLKSSFRMAGVLASVFAAHGVPLTMTSASFIVIFSFVPLFPLLRPNRFDFLSLFSFLFFFSYIFHLYNMVCPFCWRLCRTRGGKTSQGNSFRLQTICQYIWQITSTFTKSFLFFLSRRETCDQDAQNYTRLSVLM